MSEIQKLESLSENDCENELTVESYLNRKKFYKNRCDPKFNLYNLIYRQDSITDFESYIYNKQKPQQEKCQH